MQLCVEGGLVLPSQCFFFLVAILVVGCQERGLVLFLGHTCAIFFSLSNGFSANKVFLSSYIEVLTCFKSE